MKDSTNHSGWQVDLYSNDLTDKIVHALAMKPVQWDVAMKVYEHARRNSRTGLKLHQIHGMFLEIHVFLILRELLKDQFNVFLQPIVAGQVTEHFEFYRGNDDFEFNMRVRRRANGQDVAEYDMILLDYSSESNVLPIVLDMKMQAITEEGVNSKLNSALVPTKINRRFEPLVERFNMTSFAYILVVSSDTPIRKTKLQEVFQKQGGIIAPISVSYNEFVSTLAELNAF